MVTFPAGKTTIAHTNTHTHTQTQTRAQWNTCTSRTPRLCRGQPGAELTFRPAVLILSGHCASGIQCQLLFTWPFRLRLAVGLVVSQRPGLAVVLHLGDTVLRSKGARSATLAEASGCSGPPLSLSSGSERHGGLSSVRNAT